MTNKTTVAFTFANQSRVEMPDEFKVSVSQVTLGLNPVDSATTQRATAVITDVIQRYAPILKEKAEEHYTSLRASKQFTVSLEMPVEVPENEEYFKVRLFNGVNIDIRIRLTEETRKSLKESLKDSPDNVVSITTAPTSSPKSLYDPIFVPTLPLDAFETPLVKTQASNVAPPSHNIFYRFFAAIGNFFMSLLFSDTKTKYPPLIPKEHKGTRGSTIGPGVAGIRPLENGSNICFINAVFQALMNMPEEIRQTLIAAHEAKIARETKAIESLRTVIEIEEETYSSFTGSNSSRRPKLRELEASKKASIILNGALRTYTDEAKNPVWLNDLRGFDPKFGRRSQEDANNLLVQIFDPLLEPLRNGVNAEGRRDISIIPADIDPALRDSLGRLIPQFGEEKQLQLVAATETRETELAALDMEDLTELPPDGLRREPVASSILPFAIPNARTALQDLVTDQLTMQTPAEQDHTSVYVENGVRGDYQVSQKRMAIKSIGNNPPEFVSIQLKRFNRDGSKNISAIVMPENNKIRLVVNGKNVEYEIQTLVMHSGTPESGHYFSYVRKNGAWFEANDSHVAQLTKLPASVDTEAYLIFLKRVN